MWSWPWVVRLSGFGLRCRRSVGCLPYLLNAHGSSHCTFSLVTSCTVVAVVRCSSTFLASNSSGFRTFRLLLLYVWREFAHFTQTFAPRWATISLLSITVRLTFLAHSVRMRPNFQELPWFEFDGFVEDELLIRFCCINNLEKLLWFYFQSLGANLVQLFIAYDKRNTDHSHT